MADRRGDLVAYDGSEVAGKAHGLLGRAVVGVVVVEVVFIYPGLGQLMVDSVSNRDIPVVQACSMIFAGTYILLNLTADIVSICTNPRLLHPK